MNRPVLNQKEHIITPQHEHASTNKQAVQFKDYRSEAAVQSKFQKLATNNTIVQRQANNTGMPDQLISGIENLSGIDMSDVKVHYNSPQPAQLQAHAFAQGNQIHIASGQERHLPHEAWHVVQQKQGRVAPTKQLKGKININDDDGLEREADVMGAKALSYRNTNSAIQQQKAIAHPILTAQLNKYNSQSDKGGAGVGKAKPFQILATQFNAKYDIHVFHAQIVRYFLDQTTARLMPVFELRMYDGVNPLKVRIYMAQAKAAITTIVGSTAFETTISWLRDEAQRPHDGDGIESVAMHHEFINIVRSFSNHYKGFADGLTRVLAYVSERSGPEAVENMNRTCKEMYERIGGDPLAAIAAGTIMLPIPEAYALHESGLEHLVQTITGRSSYHEKAVAFLVLVGKAKGLKIVNSRFAGVSPEEAGASAAADAVAAPPIRRPRRNSTVSPQEVAIANLVMGDEQQSSDLVVSVVENAFRKGATLVHLIVEDQGMEPKREKRIDLQKRKLAIAGFAVIAESEVGRYSPDATHPAAEQSGIQVQEPLRGRTPARWRITVVRRAMSGDGGDASADEEKGSAASSPVSGRHAGGGGASSSAPAHSHGSGGGGASQDYEHPLSFRRWMEYRGYWGDYSSGMEAIMHEEYKEYLAHLR